MFEKNEIEEKYQEKMAEWEEKFNTETAKLEHKLQGLTEDKQNLQEQNEQERTNYETKLSDLHGATQELQKRSDEKIQGHLLDEWYYSVKETCSYRSKEIQSEES